MVQRISLVFVLEIGIHPQRQQMFQLFCCIIFAVFDYLNQRSLVGYIAEIYFTLVFFENHHEIILAIFGCIEKR